jgi:hypothetical protein
VNEMIGSTDDNEPLQVCAWKWSHHIIFFVALFSFWVIYLLSEVRIMLKKAIGRVSSISEKYKSCLSLVLLFLCYSTSYHVTTFWFSYILLVFLVDLGYDERSVCKLCCTESVGNLWWPATWADS